MTQNSFISSARDMKFFIIMVLVTLLTTGVLKATKNYIQNGDIELVTGNKLVGWNSSGNVKPEAVDKGWIRKTLRFNSGKHRKTDIFFYGHKGSFGSIWVDNIVCSKLKITNASFEEIDSNGRPASWKGDYKKDVHIGKVALFSDSTLASDGKRSVRITFKNEAVSTTRIWQNVQLQPNQEYVISYDILIGDDFQGEVHAAAYSGAAHITANYIATSIEDILATRDRCEKYFAVMTATKVLPAEIFKDILVEPNMNLRASVDLCNKTFKGIVSLVIEDAVSGKILKKMEIKNLKDEWQTLQMRFQSKSAKIRIRLSARGNGMIQADNIEVTYPQIIPPIQNAKWLPTTENFSIPSQLKVSVQGVSGKAIEGGLKLLEKDLKKFGVVVEKTNPGDSSLHILIGPEYEIKGKGDESYYLRVNKKGITIKAKKQAGAFYGLMSILQLIEEKEKKPVLLACDVTDYPDMPLRGAMYNDMEQAARWKINTFVESSGYIDTAKNRKFIHERVELCQSLNMDYVPYFLTLLGGGYVQKINPNLAAGIWIQDEKVTLNGTETTYLKHPYIIRTELSDIKLYSSDNHTVYKPNVDYKVINGTMGFNYGPSSKPFGVVRTAKSKIPDGATIFASYDYVDHYRESVGRADVHIPYCPVEPQAKKLMGDHIANLFKEFPFKYAMLSHCLEEFRPAEAHLETDSRVIKSNKKPIDLLAEDAAFLHHKIKEVRPDGKNMIWAGHVNDYSRAAEPKLPKDIHVVIWNYESNWAEKAGPESLSFWSKAGFETSGMTWYNLRNIWGWAQLGAKARAKGWPFLGLINAAWQSGPNPTGGFKDTAIVSWKIPKKGEKRFVELKKIE